MRNWIRAHRKQVAIHSFVIAGFLVFTLFAAEPLFDRLERTPGEAQIQRLALPGETGGIQYWIDEVEITEHLVEVRGWAFIENHDAHDSEILLVFESARRRYVFDTMMQPRPDVTAHFEDLGLDLDHSGFMSLVPIRRVASGEYTIGIYIRKGDIEALQYTDRVMEL